MLAGMVQSSSALNPYTNPEGVFERRNVVLDTLVVNVPDRAAEIRALKETPLGVLPKPNNLPRGCIAAGDRGFFCDYALQYLQTAGLSREQLEKGGYLIRTTLDPAVQGSVKAAVSTYADPKLPDIASVMNVVQPGQDQHRSWPWRAAATTAWTQPPRRRCRSCPIHCPGTAPDRYSRSSPPQQP